MEYQKIEQIKEGRGLAPTANDAWKLSEPSTSKAIGEKWDIEIEPG
jgi:hypothetical protein